jgi:uncharacterized protein YprB with RNaseH-like and TPR domain
MPRATWTQRELDALRQARSFPEFIEMTKSERSFASWDVRRRRLELEDLSRLEADEQVLADDTTPKDKEAFSKAVKAAEKPNLGEVRTFPDVITLRPAYVDLETTNLKANFGRILCASVADMYGNVRTFRIDDDPWARERRRDDVALAVGLRDYLETFDFLVGWNSKMFDVPYLNTRLLIGNERPMRMDIMHLDPMYKAGRGSLALHSRRLDAVAKTFRLPVQKTGLDPEIWNDAADGDRDAMDYVVEHCEHDVLVLRMVFHILKDLVKIVHR